MPKIKSDFYVPGARLRAAREVYQKGHLLDPDKRDRISEKIAEELEIERETLYKMERDKYNMTLKQLHKLEKIYGVELYDRDNKEVTPNENS